MESSSFSDPKVIQAVNGNFVPVQLNLTDQGFPASLPGLKMWQRAYDADWKAKFGFATSVVFDPQGRLPFGTSGSGYMGEFDTSLNYHPDRYLGFLTQSLDRYHRYEAIQRDGTSSDSDKAAALERLRNETLQQLKDANQYHSRTTGM